tara:strand:+ start:9053 stop:10402 length:1350 start_codon:yes stop_codon:yes gene_type:complete
MWAAFFMDRLTGASMARYKLRRLALNTITEEMEQLPEGNSKLSRIFNIVNQSDPDDLFAQFDEKQIIKIFSGKKSLPKSLSGTSASSPDALLFRKIRRFLFEEQHHVNPLGQNVHAISPKWSDAELNIFHRTLNDFDTGSGSTYMSLRGYDKHAHLNKVHEGGTKVEPFAKLANADPELAAVEYWVNNTGNRYIADKYYADPTTFANQILSAPEDSPLREALIKSKGKPAKFEEYLRDMNGATRAQAISEIQPDLMGSQLLGNGGATEKQKKEFRNTNGHSSNGSYAWEENGVRYSGTKQQSQAAWDRGLKNGSIRLKRVRAAAKVLDEIPLAGELLGAGLVGGYALLSTGNPAVAAEAVKDSVPDLVPVISDIAADNSAHIDKEYVDGEEVFVDMSRNQIIGEPSIGIQERNGKWERVPRGEGAAGPGMGKRLDQFLSNIGGYIRFSI